MLIKGIRIRQVYHAHDILGDKQTMAFWDSNAHAHTHTYLSNTTNTYIVFGA